MGATIHETFGSPIDRETLNFTIKGLFHPKVVGSKTTSPLTPCSRSASIRIHANACVLYRSVGIRAPLHSLSPNNAESKQLPQPLGSDLSTGKCLHGFVFFGAGDSSQHAVIWFLAIVLTPREGNAVIRTL